MRWVWTKSRLHKFWKCFLTSFLSYGCFHSIYISVSWQSLYEDSHRGQQVNYLAAMCCCPANQLWPCVAVGRGDASMREECRLGKQGSLTQDNGSVMGYTLESLEDHSSVLSCLLLPPLSCRTASLTPDKHCLFLTLVSPPQPLFLSSCPSLTASVFHSSTCCGTPWGRHHLVNRLMLLSVIKEYVCSALPGKKLLSLLLAVIRHCLFRVLGILIQPQIRSYHCAWHTKTNTPLPTQQESQCLSAAIPGYLFYKTLKVLVMSKLSIFNMIKI